MKRHMAIAGTAVLALGVLPVAFAATGSPPVVRPEPLKPAVAAAPVRPAETAKPSDRPVERLRLACEGLDRPAVVCTWSQSEHPAFAAYELWRGDGSTRTVVFRTEDVGQTRFVDEKVRPGAVYLYKIHAVNGGGHVVGEGGPVKVQAPPRRDEQLRLGCEGVRTEAGPAIACRWSESQHPDFAAYRLVRGDGQTRQVVFRTDDRSQTRFLDTDVKPGQGYVYVVQVLDAEGDVIGSGGPAKAQAPSPDIRPVATKVPPERTAPKPAPVERTKPAATPAPDDTPRG